jgi:hypothetical protein
MIINIKHPMIGYTAKDATFCAELSDIEEVRGEITRLCRVASPIYVYNPITGTQIKMTRFKVDSDGEDTYGWWYRGFNPNTGKSFKFLFIND